MASHTDEMGTREMVELCEKHTLYTWAASGKVDPLPVARAEGVYFWTPDGKRYLDFNSQLMCVNVGHSHPKVHDAIKRQLDAGLTYVYPGTATAPRARLGKLLADLAPGDLNTFFFTLGGAEANENAVRAARLYSGRFKILARYRSYHGATNLCMQLTGDPRRWHNEPGSPGIVHVFDPVPYNYSFGQTDAEIVENHLRYLEETIQVEGPDTIAAMIIESVTGTNGVLAPPEGWMQGLRKLLDKYGILMICDEVMAGFGRTGKMWAFEHWGVVPDIVTMAKGLTSSYVPLGAMGLRDKIADHFRENVFWGGLTYNSHALACATAEAVIEVMLEEKLLERSTQMGALMRQHMDRLAEKHPCFKEARQIGLFGMIDLQRNSKGDPAAPFNGSSPAMNELGAFFHKEGLFTFIRWGSFMCNPPLVITEAQLDDAFDIIDRGLSLVDAHFEG